MQPMENIIRIARRDMAATITRARSRVKLTRRIFVTARDEAGGDETTIGGTELAHQQGAAVGQVRMGRRADSVAAHDDDHAQAEGIAAPALLPCRAPCMTGAWRE
jgi:hypothetical protein